MFRKRWSHVSMLAAIVLTSTLSIIISVLLVSVEIKKEKDTTLGFLKKDQKIFAGVVIPNQDLFGSDQENCDYAKDFLANKECIKWKHVNTFNNPLGYKYRVFVFEAVNSNEMLALK